MPTSATVEDQNPKIAPLLTAGTITPKVLHRWERSCKEYFRTKDVSAKKQVESVLSRLADMRIADWAEANEEALRSLDFAAFMEKLRGQALEKDWDRKIKLSMLAMKQGERTFHEWAYELLNRNALLRGRSCHFDDEALHELFRNNMDQGLELCTRKFVIGEGETIRDWIETVKVEAEFVASERVAVREMAKEMYRMEQQKGVRGAGVGRTMGTRIENTVQTIQRPAAGSSALPKITPVERTLLFDHQGCFKCRRFYVDHVASNCPNGFPSASTYRTLTPAFAESVRDSKNKPRSQNLGPVAHIGFSGEAGTENMPSAVLGTGEEESDDSSKYVRAHDPPPFSSGHLEWRCCVDGPSVSKPIVVTALIDNGSPSVLIDEGLVLRLGLRRRRLPAPRRARLAMGDGEMVLTE